MREVKRDRDNLRRLIREFGFGEYEEKLINQARPSIRVETQRVDDEKEILLGESKIGGRPDLPPEIDWIRVLRKDEKISLPFIAQFDLEDIKLYDEENLLPEKGMLYFFGDPWRGAGWKEHGKVIYFEGDKSLLIRREFPDDIPYTPPDEWGERYDPCKVSFIPEVNLPLYGDFRFELPQLLNEQGDDQFFDLYEAANYRSSEHRTVNRLLGYNDDVPQDMQLECQLIADTGYPYNASPETRAKAEQHKSDWQLLFQLDSDENAAMMWSDMGKLFFFIRLQDLKNHDFDNICLISFSS
jgi:uncharacterized protein YwqG